MIWVHVEDPYIGKQQRPKFNIFPVQHKKDQLQTPILTINENFL